MYNLIDEIERTKEISLDVFLKVMECNDAELLDYLYSRARSVRESIYGKDIYIRGLIEISNYCKNNCYYCGIRNGNAFVERYRLTPDEILECCHIGYKLGFRTFVLQGGEDAYFTDTVLENLIRQIRKEFTDCAITLSLGERDKESYERLFEAGANRYLLRHETACETHYQKLHPSQMSFQNRIQCLKNLKAIGYQVGCGFMVGAPYQTMENLYQDLQLICELQPQMVGIGPFVPARNTPFEKEAAGTVDATRRLLALIRLLRPNVLLPSTTALGTIHPEGTQLGILAGANVVMPNLSPLFARTRYNLYDRKANRGSEAAEGLTLLKNKMKRIGYQVVIDRGDYAEGI